MSKSYEFVFNIGANLGAGFKAAFASASGTMKNLGSNIKDLKAAQKMYDSALKAGTITQKSYDAGINKITASLNRQKNAQKNLSSAIAAQDKVASMRNNAQRSMMGAITAGSALAAPAFSAVTTAADFEAIMSKVKAITGATSDDFQRLNDTARELGASTQFTATQAGEAMTYLGMAGWKTNEIIAGMPGLLSLAAAGGTDLARTADIISDDLTAFGLSADQAGHMADVFAVTITRTNTNVEMLGETMKYAAPVAEAFGASMEETSALAGLMANSGIKASQAGTALRSGFLRLAGPPKAAGKAMAALGMDMSEMNKAQEESKAVMESLGIQMEDTNGPRKMSAIVRELAEKTAGLSKEEKLATMQAIFGKEAATGWLAVIKAGPEQLDELTTALENSNGAADEMAKIMLDNAKGAITQMQSAIESAAIAIGNNFLPYVKDLAMSVADIASRTAAWAKENPTTVTTILSMTAAVGTAIVGFTGLAYVVLSVIYPFMQLHKMYQTIKASMVAAELAQKAFNLTALSNPYLWIAIAVVAACLIIYANWDSITSFMSSAWQSTCSTVTNLWNGFCNFMSSAWELLKAGVTGFITLWVNLPSYIAYAIGFLIGYIATLPRKIATFIIVAGNFLYELPGYCYNAGIQFAAVAEAWLSNAYSSTVTWISVMVNEAGVWLMGLPDTCMEAGMQFVASAESWASEAYNSVVNWISQIPSAISNYISNAWSNLSGSFTVGMADGGNVQVAQNAQGGIYGKGSFLTTFAEEGPEAAIPLDGSPRAISLWQQAGQALGMGTGGSTSVNAPISITINGNADQSTVQQIKSAVDDSLAGLKRNLSALQNQNRRVAYD
mgnify:CR=1 FL=1